MATRALLAELARGFEHATGMAVAVTSVGGVEAARRVAAGEAFDLVLLVVDDHKGDPEIDICERLVSAGAAVQSMLLMATALGFGSALTSGKALKSDAFRHAFDLSPGEFAPCFISIGTVSSAKPGKPRPDPSAIVSTWAG